MGRGTEGGTRWLRKETSADFGEIQMGQDIQGPFGSVASGGCGWSTLVARLPLHISIQPQPATWWQKVFLIPHVYYPAKHDPHKIGGGIQGAVHPPCCTAVMLPDREGAPQNALNQTYILRPFQGHHRTQQNQSIAKAPLMEHQ